MPRNIKVTKNIRSKVKMYLSVPSHRDEAGGKSPITPKELMLRYVSGQRRGWMDWVTTCSCEVCMSKDVHDVYIPILQQ